MFPGSWLASKACVGAIDSPFGAFLEAENYEALDVKCKRPKCLVKSNAQCFLHAWNASLSSRVRLGNYGMHVKLGMLCYRLSEGDGG